MATKKQEIKIERVELVTKQGFNVTVGSDVVDSYLKRGYKLREAPASETPTKK